MFNYDLDEIKSELALESEVLAFEEDFINFEQLCDIAKADVAMENKITEMISSTVGKAKKFLSTMFGWVNSIVGKFTRIGRGMQKDTAKAKNKIMKKLKSVTVAKESLDISNESADITDVTEAVNVFISYAAGVSIIAAGADLERKFYKEGSAAKRLFFDNMLWMFIALPIDLLLTLLLGPAGGFIAWIWDWTVFYNVVFGRQAESKNYGLDAFNSFSYTYLQDMITPLAMKKVKKVFKKHLYKVTVNRVFTSTVKDHIQTQLNEVLAKRDWVSSADLNYSTELADGDYKKFDAKITDKVRDNIEKLKDESIQNINDITFLRIDKADYVRTRTKEYGELIVQLRNTIKNIAK